MPLSRSTRLAALILANILIPLAVLVFATGFFPYKPFLPGLASFEDERSLGGMGGERPRAVFDRVVFMVVDALRSDFVFGEGSGFGFVQSLVRSGAAIPFTAHATPPTVTMPRVKALTTGSVPSFLDLILNFAESDTSSSLAGQDTWLAQIKAKTGVTGGKGRIVFYGDDTWLKLFPSGAAGISSEAGGAGAPFFARADGTTSFFVSDFTEVDNNVTRHVPAELERQDWDAMILHYLGLDHIGHKTGPQGPNMLPKQREMDGIVRVIYEAMKTEKHHERTLLVLAGDHGMNAGGNHGGSGPGETEPALVFVSPRFATIKNKSQYECPTRPKEGTEFHFYTKVQQSDLVPALAGLMGMPVSKNSLGMFLRDLGGCWTDGERVELLVRNARQLVGIVGAKYGEGFERRAEVRAEAITRGERKEVEVGGDEDRLVRAWGEVLYLLGRRSDVVSDEGLEEALYRFLGLAQETMSDTASLYNIPRMATGMGVVALALVLALLSSRPWPPTLAGTSLVLISLLYGIMMFASSYVEEEQHFWYWSTPIWIFLLAAKRLRQHQEQRSLSSSVRTIAAALLLITAHRLAVRWNQTGQKHSGEPDIVHTFFPDHHISMWILILLTYLMIGYMVHFRTCGGLMPPEVTALIDTVIVFPIIFKINFTQADAPELVLGLAAKLREMTGVLTLVQQARIAFGTIFVAAGVVTAAAWRRAGKRRLSNPSEDGKTISLPERLHPLLALYLMTQTRAPNVPLFMLFELQRVCLQQLVAPPSSETKQPSPAPRPSAAEIATTVLLLSHTFYFCIGGSNSISSIDLSNAYNGVADYNIAAVGVLLFASNWAGPLLWCSSAVLLCDQPAGQAAGSTGSKAEGERDWVVVERTKLHRDAVEASRQAGINTVALEAGGEWTTYITCTTAFIATALLAVMAACTALRTHLFIWTVFSPKYLYALAWSLAWHLIVNVGLGSALWWLCRIRN